MVALHRGVGELEAGDLDAALRSLAYALDQASDSEQAPVVRSLSLRWLSYVAAQFEITDSLLATMQQLVPARDYSLLLEDLMWRAAFRADAGSFEHGVANQRGRGALSRRLDLLRPLAQGDIARFSDGVRTNMANSPSETLRFVDELLQRIELEDEDVRAAHARSLDNLRIVLRTQSEAGGSGWRAKKADELLGRAQAILEGVGVTVSSTHGDRARNLAPTSVVYAGSIRLAPSDPLPWPFAAPTTTPPSVFAPLTLTPVEWHDADGALVFGWSIEG